MSSVLSQAKLSAGDLLVSAETCVLWLGTEGLGMGRDYAHKFVRPTSISNAQPEVGSRGRLR